MVARAPAAVSQLELPGRPAQTDFMLDPPPR
jgi:hypothetical protein